MINLDDNIPIEEVIESEEEGGDSTPFDPSQVRVEARPMTIDLVLERIKYQEIDLAPDFQRNDNIWNNTAQSRLIESILIRIPLPAFYIDATNDDKWLIIDGLQRLTAIKKFVIDNELKLQDLEYLAQLEDCKYEEISRNYQRRIKETVLTIYTIEKGTPPELKFNIFRRINTGGEGLSPQELRHALNPGLARIFLKELAEISNFKRIVPLGDTRKNRMKDREFVLGFAAYYLTSYQDYPAKEGRDYFLNQAMIKLNKLSPEQLKEINHDFNEVMNLAWDIFGDSGFRKIIVGRKQPLNQSLFEAWSVILSKLDKNKQSCLIARKEELIVKFAERIDRDPEFLKSISQASEKISYRFETVQAIIDEVVNA
jgi:uncharacterized protein with ParB-like and HNH nuclease domain